MRGVVLKIKNDISLFVTSREENILIYFNVDDIDDISKIKKAYILLETDTNFDFTDKLYLNDRFSPYDFGERCSGISKNIDSDLYEIYKNYVDITESFHLLASKVVENKGFILKSNGIKEARFKLHFTYIEREIIPNFDCDFFCEEELFLSNLKGLVISPWFLIKNATMISFYAKNLSQDDIVVSLQNSPNAKDFTNDIQSIVIASKCTGVIVPATFSKYVRVVLQSNCKPIATKVWFQAQLIK